MSIFLVELWMPKQGMERKCIEISSKILDYIKSNRERFRELKSVRLFNVWIGDRHWFITTRI